MAAALLSSVLVTWLAHVAPGWGEAVQAGFSPGQWLLAVAFADWSRLRR
ncbi:hypothetical protein [Streptomyces sp. NPDC089919]